MITIKDLQKGPKEMMRLQESKKVFLTSNMNSVSWEDRLVESFVNELDEDELLELREGLIGGSLNDLRLGHTLKLKEALDITGYPVLLRSGIKQALYKGYKLPVTHFESLVEVETSSKKEEEYGGLYETDLPEKVEPGDEYPESAMGEKSAKIKNHKYGRLLSLELELGWFDQQNKILQKARGLGRGARLFQEKTAMDIIQDVNSDSYRPSGTATDLYSATFGNLFTSKALTTANFESVMASIRKYTDDNSNYILSEADTWLGPIELEGAMSRIMKSKTYSGDADYAHDEYNYARERYGSRFRIIASPFFSAQSATSWYLMSKMMGTLIYQEVKPISVMEEDAGSTARFERDIQRFKVMLYFGLGYTDWRGSSKATA